MAKVLLVVNTQETADILSKIMPCVRVISKGNVLAGSAFTHIISAFKVNDNQDRDYVSKGLRCRLLPGGIMINLI